MKRIISVLAVIVVVVIAGLIWFKQDAAAPTPKSTTATKAKTPSTSPTQSTFDKTAYSTTDPNSIWVIVNKQHPLNPLDFAPADLVSVGNGQQMRSAAAQALSTMLAAAKTAGFVVTPASGYRSYATQVSVYNNEVNSYGQATADSESARPGYSEHQTGLAVDLASDGCSITDCFGTTPGGKWVTANAYKYGFLLRYPADKTDTTGYRAEAWHFRYIGVSLATELQKQHIATLEEFFGVTGGTAYN